ncbi:MAG: hypothetical protein JOZ05_10205 [Acetobacteraceae bacterium]|nr:hypothetical protein [Acetobacteraceae bacterium]
MRAGALRVVALCCALGASACSLVDSGLYTRTETLTRGYDQVQNSNLLLNMVRAGRNEPLRFYSVTKVIPNQLTDLKIGLPTITFGPAQTPLQRQFVFSGNIVDNSASMSYEIDPLETENFYNAMTEPIPADLMAKLFRLFPREFAFNVLFDSVRVRQAPGPGSDREYKNEPQAASAACPPVDYKNYDPKLYNPGIADDTTYNPAREQVEGNTHSECGFEKFQYYVAMAMKYGATIRSEPNTPATVPTNSASPPAAKPATTAAGPAQKGAGQQQPPRTARFCYDPALARADVANVLASESPTVCGRPSGSGAGGIASPIRIGWRSPDGRVTVVDQQIELVPRSPIGLFLYLGRQLDRTSGARVPLFSQEATAGDGQLLTVERRPPAGGCFAEAEDWSGSYCVPNRGAANTKRVFLLLTLLTGLSTSPLDVQSTPTVRVTP